MHNDIVFEALDHQLGGGSPITSCGHDRLEGSAAKRRLQLWVRPIRAADANPVRSADRDLAASAAMEA